MVTFGRQRRLLVWGNGGRALEEELQTVKKVGLKDSLWVLADSLCYGIEHAVDQAWSEGICVVLALEQRLVGFRRGNGLRIVEVCLERRVDVEIVRVAHVGGCVARVCACVLRLPLLWCVCR